MYFVIITTGVLVSSLQGPIGTSVSNHLHKRGSEDSNEGNCINAEALEWLQCCIQQAKNAKTAEIRLFDRNLREEKLTFQPDQPGENFLWVTTKLFAEKNSLKQDFPFFVA